MAGNLQPYLSVKVAVEPGYSRHVQATKPLRRFSETIPFVRKLNDEVLKENSSAAEDFLGVTCLNFAVLSSLGEDDGMIDVKTTAGRT